jgi:hypothetical protein
VQVPAGTFEATRIEITQSWTSPSQTNDRGESVQRTLSVWYAPEVKRAGAPSAAALPARSSTPSTSSS